MSATTWDKPEEKLHNLPRWLSNHSNVNRLIAFYSAIYYNRYGVVPTIANWGQTGMLLKKVLKNNTEIKVAAVMWVYFFTQDNFLGRNYYPINLLPRHFTESETRLREAIGEKMDDPKELKRWLKKQTLEVLKEYQDYYESRQSSQ